MLLTEYDEAAAMEVFKEEGRAEDIRTVHFPPDPVNFITDSPKREKTDLLRNCHFADSAEMAVLFSDNSAFPPAASGVY